MHFWSFWAKYCHFLHILSNDRPKTMWTRCLGGFSIMWVTKLLISQVKKKDFLPQNDQIWPKIGIFGWYGPGHACFFGALLVGRLAVVACGLYLARHLFTLSSCPTEAQPWYGSSLSLFASHSFTVPCSKHWYYSSSLAISPGWLQNGESQHLCTCLIVWFYNVEFKKR